MKADATLPLSRHAPDFAVQLALLRHRSHGDGRRRGGIARAALATAYRARRKAGIGGGRVVERRLDFRFVVDLRRLAALPMELAARLLSRKPARIGPRFTPGVDDATPTLRELFESDGAAYDFFDAKVMVEPSIHRARAVSRPEIAAINVDFRALNLASDSLDAAFVMLAAHELRERADRARFFDELKRVLKPNAPR